MRCWNTSWKNGQSGKERFIGENTSNFRIDRRYSAIPRPLDTWLDRTVSDYDQLMHLLEPYPDDDMEWYEVSPTVGNVRNDVPECVLPLN